MSGRLKCRGLAAARTTAHMQSRRSGCMRHLCGSRGRGYLCSSRPLSNGSLAVSSLDALESPSIILTGMGRLQMPFIVRTGLKYWLPPLNSFNGWDALMGHKQGSHPQHLTPVASENRSSRRLQSKTGCLQWKQRDSLQPRRWSVCGVAEAT